MQDLTFNSKINIYYLLKKINSNNYISKINLLNMTSYCIIKVLDNKTIQLSYYVALSMRETYVPIIFTANNAKSICDLMQYHQNIFITLSSCHALYLGRELIKAEFALIMNQQYVQS
jgi:hypothetical protein